MHIHTYTYMYTHKKYMCVLEHAHEWGWEGRGKENPKWAPHPAWSPMQSSVSQP